MANDLYPTRVRFTDGQFLQAADLADEQTYHLLMRWRHNLGLHSWGILTGLEIQLATAPGSPLEMLVLGGMALDGYGREIVLAQPAPAAPFANDFNAVYDVLIGYNHSREKSTTDGALGRNRCPAPRFVEQPAVVVVKTADRPGSDPTRPGEVPEGDLDFTADGLPPDDPNRPWPVLLGRVSYSGDSWVVDSSVRRYAGLIADRIEAPIYVDPSDGSKYPPRTVLFNGTDPGSAYSFAVVSVPPGSAPDPDSTPPIIGIRSQQGDERIEFCSTRVSVEADMVFRNGSAMEFQPNPVGAQGLHAQAGPGIGLWRLYHHFEPPAPLTPQTATTQSNVEIPLGVGGTNTPSPSALPKYSEELRLTMPASPANRVAIGCADDKGKFTPVLTVNGDNTVTIYGNLTVLGGITGLPADAPAGLGGAAVVNVGDIFARAVRVFPQATTSDQFKALIEPLFGSSLGRPALRAAIADKADATDIAIFAPAFWSDDTKAKALGAAANNASPDTGPNVKIFLDFLTQITSPIPDDAGSQPLSQVVGDWLFRLDGTGAAGIADINFSNAKDDAIAGFAISATKDVTLELSTAKFTKLIQKLITHDGAAEEMMRQIAANKPEVIGDLFPTDPDTIKTILNGIYKDTPASSRSITAKATALGTAWTEYSPPNTAPPTPAPTPPTAGS